MAISGGRETYDLLGRDAASREEQNITTDELMRSEYNMPVALMERRHLERILGTPQTTGTWRMKERMKTVSVALVLCLNVGVDPPDVMKIQPCAREECWIDPLVMSPKKALETIGSSLQKQYERWQPRARSKLSMDPTMEEVKKLCQSLRRNAKEERVLFHYNGHGVPKPTENGEIWVFNKNYTQYIPLSLYTLQQWMSTPSIYVFDCSNAALILDKFTEFQQTRDVKMELNESSMASSTGSSNSGSEVCRQCILLGACNSNELLPQDPNLPADLFTSCLTTPIRMALRWYVLQSGKLVKGLTKELVDKIPGALNDRRTMLGELNWIFTAITDTIAWNVLSRETFQKLFRQDLLVASLFRNYLLAERIMRSYSCTVVSNQRLPPTHQHPMWQAWDYTLDACLSQLPAIASKKAEFQYSTFFSEQLTAFQVWLEHLHVNSSSPDQLPIVLQVLLSQVHRLRALELLSRFLDHGPKAVSLALSVGIFPYVLRLLQGSTREIRPLLVLIWAKILSVDGSCQADLVKDGGHRYFLQVLEDREMPSEYRTMAAFVLSMIVYNYQPGQESVYQGKAIYICLLPLDYTQDYRLRTWCALCLGQIWHRYPLAKWAGVRDTAHEKLICLLTDEVPEVRCAALFALGTFINQVEGRGEQSIHVDHHVGIQICKMSSDPSPMVREEVLAAIAGFIAISEAPFLTVARQSIEEEALAVHIANSPPAISSPRSSPVGRLKSLVGSPKSKNEGGFMNGGYGSHDRLNELAHSASPIRRVPSTGSTLALTNVYNNMWRTLLQMTADPFPSVFQQAGIIVNSLKQKASSGTASRNASEHQHSTSSRCDKMIDTEFFQWCCKMFEKSVMAEFCSSHPTNQRQLEQERQAIYTSNVQVKVKAAREHLQAPYTPIDTEVFSNRMSTLPVHLRFHPYDIRLAVADTDSVSIWDWEASVKLHQFYNHTSKSCKISGLHYLNPQEGAKSLLAVASDDGAVRVWTNSSSRHGEVSLVTAWQAISESPHRKFGNIIPRMIMEWQQSTSCMYFGGAYKSVRMFDVSKECSVMDMPVGYDACVTSLNCDSLASHLLTAACSDGSIRVFDNRLPSDSSPTCILRHGSYVLNCQMLKGYGDSLVSACRSGEIKFWDLRKQESIGAISTGSTLRNMVLHKQSDLIACGLSEQMISVYNMTGDVTSLIKYHEGFMSQKLAKISCLEFHPHLVKLACGNQDGMVSVFTMSDKAK
ncbi:regulatory-associated protein of mTOR-like [Watersipora subatra]|uniref:regulatory-associated protein of mTOR-like n=1 Tax=Watersipora subatra TaxID=2589382 RepID=UPI00355B8C7D